MLWSATSPSTFIGTLLTIRAIDCWGVFGTMSQFTIEISGPYTTSLSMTLFQRAANYGLLCGIHGLRVHAGPNRLHSLWNIPNRPIGCLFTVNEGTAFALRPMAPHQILHKFVWFNVDTESIKTCKDFWKTWHQLYIVNLEIRTAWRWLAHSLKTCHWGYRSLNCQHWRVAIQTPDTSIDLFRV